MNIVLLACAIPFVVVINNCFHKICQFKYVFIFFTFQLPNQHSMRQGTWMYFTAFIVFVYTSWYWEIYIYTNNKYNFTLLNNYFLPISHVFMGYFISNYRSTDSWANHAWLMYKLCPSLHAMHRLMQEETTYTTLSTLLINLNWIWFFSLLW